MTDELKQLPAYSRDQQDNLDASTRISQLRELLHLFDFVLCEEFTQEHRRGALKIKIRLPGAPQTRASSTSASSSSTPAPQSQPEGCNLACDFCSADLFLTYFECQNCGEKSGDHTVGSGLLICPACYVEGRTCECTVMTMRQCRSFEDLLKDRNMAAAALNIHLESSRRIEELSDA